MELILDLIAILKLRLTVFKDGCLDQVFSLLNVDQRLLD
jgi:hypothetical protein